MRVRWRSLARLAALAAILIVVIAGRAWVLNAAGAEPRDPSQPSDAGREPEPAAVEALRQALFAGLGLRPGMSVADVGAGRGWFTFRAAEAVGSAGAVYATDIDQGAVAALQQKLSHLSAHAARVQVRQCKGPWDTALDDLPPESLDLILMVDSLCFDERLHGDSADYLKKMFRLLRPGGRLIHHMDCRCNVTPTGLAEQFAAAGFLRDVEVIELPPDVARASAGTLCDSDDARRRHWWVPVIRKPKPNAGV